MGKLYDLLNTLIGKVNNSVKVEAQTLTDAQKEQARKNIGAAAEGEGGGSTEGAVLYTEQTLTDEQKTQARANIGAASADIIVSDGGDTLTWDGNTEGLVSAADVFYKVSDVVPTLEDFKNGCAITLCGEDIEFSYEDAENSCDVLNGVIGLDGFYVVPADLVGEDIFGMSFPEAGIYFVNDGYDVCTRLTIPGYTGFATEKLNPKLMPSWNDLKDKPFSDTEVVVLEEQELAYDADNEGYLAEPLCSIEPGDAITVVFDGTSYSCTAIAMQYMCVFGNLSLIGEPEDTGEPFFGAYMDGALMFITADALNHTVGVSVIKVQPIDEKYVPKIFEPRHTVFSWIGGDPHLCKEGTFGKDSMITRAELAMAVSSGQVLLADPFSINRWTPVEILIGDDYGSVTFVTYEHSSRQIKYETRYTAEHTP